MHNSLSSHAVMTTQSYNVVCRCVTGSYPSPTGTVRVDFELSPNEQRVVTDKPSHIIDDSVTLVKLDRLTVCISLVLGCLSSRSSFCVSYVEVQHAKSYPLHFS